MVTYELRIGYDLEGLYGAVIFENGTYLAKTLAGYRVEKAEGMIFKGLETQRS